MTQEEIEYNDANTDKQSTSLEQLDIDLVTVLDDMPTNAI